MTITTSKPTSYKGTEPYLFVSYSHFDDIHVYPLIHYLQNHNVRVWYDEGIAVGSEYPRILEEAILNSAVFLQFVSTNAVESDFCRKEIGLSLDTKGEQKTIIAYIQEAELKYGLRLELRNIQRIQYVPNQSVAELGERIITNLYRIEPQVFSNCVFEDSYSCDDSGENDKTTIISERSSYSIPLELLVGSVENPNISESKVRNICRCIYEEAGSNIGVRVLSTIDGPKKLAIDVEFESSDFEIDYDLYAGLIGNQVQDKLDADYILVENVPNEANVVRFSIPVEICSTVSLRGIIDTHEFRKNDVYLPLGLGVSSDGTRLIRDLSESKNLWIGGQGGSGKTDLIRSMLVSLLYKNAPSDLRITIASPNSSDFEPFNEIPHLRSPVISDSSQLAKNIDWFYKEMMHRYQVLGDAQINSLVEYIQKCKQNNEVYFPRLVMVIDGIDDYVDLLPQEQENQLCRLTQMGHLVGIYLIIASSKVHEDSFMVLLRSNFSMIIALRMNSGADSEALIKEKGAEKLRLPGDMLVFNPGDLRGRPIRIRGSYTSTEEIHAVTSYLKELDAVKQKKE